MIKYDGDVSELPVKTQEQWPMPSQAGWWEVGFSVPDPKQNLQSGRAVKNRSYQ